MTTFPVRLALLMSQAQVSQYRLQDEFTSPIVAPIPSPRHSEPGPGQMVIIADTGNRVSIASDMLRQTSGGGFGDPAYYWRTSNNESFARRVGRAFTWKVNQFDGSPVFGLSSLTSLALVSMEYAIFGQAYYRFGAQLASVYPSNSSGATLTYWWVLRSSGAFCFYKTAAGSIELVWVEERGNTALWPGLTGATGATRNIADFVRVMDVGGAFTTDFGISLVNTIGPASSSSYTTTASHLTDFAFTPPTSPSAGDKIELRYRILDSSNYWTAYLERNAGNTAWDFKADSVIGGVATNRVSVTGVGTPDRIRVTANGTTHNFFTYLAGTPTKRGSAVTVTTATLDSQAAISPVFVAGTAAGSITSFPRTSSFYDVLGNV